MTKMKKIAFLGIMVLAISVFSTATFAAVAGAAPADVAADVTGRTVDSVRQERVETGKTFGTIAKEAGNLEQFKAQILQAKKEVLAQKVAEGTMTQERADEIMALLEQHQAACDGTGSAKIGREMGAGFGGMNGNGKGQGQGQGNGNSQGLGQGQGGVSRGRA